ncbi:MAG: hypothetical protein WA775_10825 [Psychroserpens sp.]|uniref:hypothetical protein n=1 Tax=Psychroserpens sp. TaxID=2020870 RepID=UPI003C71F028
MKSLLKVFIISLILSFNSFAQQNNLSDSEQNRLNRYQEEAENNKREYISDFMSTLEIDEFQREIIFQALNTYFEKFINIQKTTLKRTERTAAIEHLDDYHFKDVRSIVSEATMSKIMDAVKGKWDKKAFDKEKKRKRRNKN